MPFADFDRNILKVVAATADICMKPWRHSIVDQGRNLLKDMIDEDLDELIFKIECRSEDGERCPENDLELEIYKSGSDLNLMIGWSNHPERPILWQGQHPVWMDSNNGNRCQSPTYGNQLEAFARRLRSILVVK